MARKANNAKVVLDGGVKSVRNAPQFNEVITDTNQQVFGSIVSVEKLAKNEGERVANAVVVVELGDGGYITGTVVNKDGRYPEKGESWKFWIEEKGQNNPFGELSA